MPHLMKPRLTSEDRDRNPIRESEKKDNDKVVKPKDVFEGYKDQKKTKKPKKKCVKVCPKGNKVCHCANKKKVPKGSHLMSDGSIMKDSDMKKKTKSKY